MAEIELVLPWPPALNRLYRIFQGRFLISREGRSWKEQAGWLALVAGVTPLEGPVGVTLDLYRPRKRGDIDGYCKALLDAMQGHLWHNDDQIVEMHVFRWDDKTSPRVEVRAWQVSQVDP